MVYCRREIETDFYPWVRPVSTFSVVRQAGTRFSFEDSILDRAGTGGESLCPSPRSLGPPVPKPLTLNLNPKS